MKKNGVEIVGGSIELKCPYCNTRTGCAALDAREDLMGQYNAELWLGSVDWSGLTDLASVFLHISFRRFLVLVQAKKAKKVKKSQAKQGRSKF